MTTSEMLLDKVRREAIFGPSSGSDLAKFAMEMAKEYEIAIKDNLRLETTIHRLTK